MAAEMVIRENLEKTLEGLDNLGVTLAPSLREKLEKLREQVRRSQGAVVPLEGRDHIHGISMRVQLEKLLTKLHQADDLVDQILTFEYRSKLCRGVQEGNARENRSQLVRQVSRSTQEVFLLSSFNQLFFPKKMARRVEKISHEMGSLVGQLRNENDTNNPHVQNGFQQIAWDRPVKNELIGRDNDKKKIVEMLLQPPPKDSTSNVSIIYMSGLPGVGKSALANDIYEDPKVKSYFDLLMLVPVSQITDSNEIVRETVEICTNRRSSYSDNTQSAHYHNGRVGQNDTILFRDILGCRSSSRSPSSPKKSARQNVIDIFERRLRKEIKGKRYLLILDDCCLERWQSLKKLLAGGARGSKILVTTRLAEVADLVNSENIEVKHYPLLGLSKDHSWTLFRTLALEQTEPDNGEMKEIGSEIADICEQLPLTIKIAASLLHGRPTDKWLNFKEKLTSIKNLDGDIMDHVLRLSCFDLPTRLRACFEYCSLFPDDFIFNKHDLISLWIAQGFVNPHEDQSLEKTGEMYFIELSRRCLFEEVSTDKLGNILTCKMHHIVCRLSSKFTATGVANIHTTTSSMISFPNPTYKHVSVHCRGRSSLKFSSPLLKGLSLRTLIFVKGPDCDIKMDTSVCNKLISSYRRLRVLDLHDLGLKELPDSIGEQTHLRYLDLSKNDDLITLPNSFNRLYNLQTLKLNSCPKLKPLSIDFGLLANLKRFEVDECDSLTCMPFGLEKLSHQLETLSRFVVGKESSRHTASVGLEELSKLTMLRGRLVIEFLGDWLTNTHEDDQVELARNGLKNMSELSEVKIRWAHRSSDVNVEPDAETQAHKAILDHLQPNENLKILCIEGYRGGDFPSWANIETISSSLPNLVIISIEGCVKCQYLPPFGELIHLKKLTLRHMTNVLYVENPAARNEGVDQNSSLFISLEELTLHNFYELRGWRKEVALVKNTEPQSFPCLSKLRISNCPSLISLPSFPNVKNLKLRNVNQMLLDDCARKASIFKNKINTTTLKIKGCPDLAGFDVVRKGLGGLPSLEHLVIESCNSLSSLTSDLKSLTSLVSLRISSCKELDLSLEAHSTFRQFQNSTWIKLKNLRELTLVEIPKMKTLPEGLKHVKSLKMLWISACQSLGSLPEWISSLTSLQHLRIESCHALKRLPTELKDVTSLIKVEITECPELMERCREHKGEDWPYIKHARVLLHKSWRYGYVSQESHAHSIDTQVDTVQKSLPQQLVSIVFNT